MQQIRITATLLLNIPEEVTKKVAEEYPEAARLVVTALGAAKMVQFTANNQVGYPYVQDIEVTKHEEVK